MKFAEKWSMRAELLEAREDEYDEIVDKDSEVQALYERVSGYVGCIRDALIKGNASSEAIDALYELDDMIYAIVAKVTDCLAEEACIETYIAYQVGLHYAELVQVKKARREMQDDAALN